MTYSRVKRIETNEDITKSKNININGKTIPLRPCEETNGIIFENNTKIEKTRLNYITNFLSKDNVAFYIPIFKPEFFEPNIKIINKYIILLNQELFILKSKEKSLKEMLKTKSKKCRECKNKFELKEESPLLRDSELFLKKIIDLIENLQYQISNQNNYKYKDHQIEEQIELRCPCCSVLNVYFTKTEDKKDTKEFYKYLKYKNSFLKTKEQMIKEISTTKKESLSYIIYTLEKG